MTCKHCNTATINRFCIHCVARLILQLPLKLQDHSIEMNGKFDVDELKAVIIKLNKESKK